MATTRISPKYQVTIPKPVFDQVGLEPGDFLNASVESGRIILTPKRPGDKHPDAELTARERKTLARAQAKISAINTDIHNARGLTPAEIAVAAKAGLIDPDQAYVWTELWQKDLREAQQDIVTGRLSEPVNNAADLLAQLRTLKQRPV